MNSSIETLALPMQRMKCIIRGAVQGVGFRPFIYRLSTGLGLRGWVSNSPQGVLIEVEGLKSVLDQFLLRIEKEKPPHAHIQGIETSFLDPVHLSDFEIRESAVEGEQDAFVAPDIAMCPDCESEVFDSTDRRFLYPFTNCTHCGPRYSIISALPYDRKNTSMQSFEMCDECTAEYVDPRNRRFHAQPNACPSCGPHVELWLADGTSIAKHHHAIQLAAENIREGKIVALKGLGGFHLIVDARNSDAVTRLRQRKHRSAKPLAVMFPSMEMIKEECCVSKLEERLMRSPEAPIVLLQRRSFSNQTTTPHSGTRISPVIAPGNPDVGAILPYTPLHHILLRDLGFPVVATSGNLSDEPICTDEHEALQRLRDIADVFLVHDRPILRHVDDSVARIVLGREQILRRSRGYAPMPITLHHTAPPLLAVGAHQKNTVAITKGENVFVSQHIGDLETEQAFDAFSNVVANLKSLLRLQPESIMADMHPDYMSTHYAKETSLPVTFVQHHHAHVLSCMAENELDGPVLGVAWDGTGYGPDGTIWGGEFLLAEGKEFRRIATFQQFRLPGNSKSVKEPRRTALGVLFEICGNSVFEMTDLAPVAAFSKTELVLLRQMLSKHVNSPVTTSVGRLFDAVASIAGISQRVSFEGQAAMELEFAIQNGNEESAYPFRIERAISDVPHVIDWSLMIAEIIRDVNRHENVSTISQRFHNTLVQIIVDIATIVDQERVVLTGGCFQNRYLTERAVEHLQKKGFRPYWHQRVPPNDGGIALGQVYAGVHSTANEDYHNQESHNHNRIHQLGSL